MRREIAYGRSRNPTFLQILPTAAFLSSSGLTIHGFPRLNTVASEHVRFYFLVFLFSTVALCRFRAVD